MESQENFEMIERYLNNEMLGDEKKAFESNLESNSELKSELKIQKDLRLAVEMGALKHDLNDIHDKLFVGEKSSSNNWLAIAAGFAIILTLGVWIINQNGKPSDLFATYSTTDPGLPVPMSSTNHYLFYDAMVDYKAEKYEKAIEKWKGLLRAEPQNDTLNYYTGSSYFNLSDYEKATEYFEKVGREEGATLRDKAQWYSVLAWIELEDFKAIQQAKPYAGSPYEQRIEEIKSAVQK